MKNVFIFMLFFVPVFIQAQDTSLKNKSISICTHDDGSLHFYDWHEVEAAFAKQIKIPVYKCEDFFAFAFSQGYLSMAEYRSLVKSGVVMRENALHYWLGKLPLCEEVYKNEYQSFLAAKQSGNNAVMSSCNNLDFATGTTTNWTGQWNDQGSSGTINGIQGYGNLTQTGFYSGGFNSETYVQEICTSGTDPNVPISRVPPGHTYSIRLGSDSAYQQNQINPTNLTPLPFFHQTISNTFLVTPSNKTITYWYAVCLTQNASNPHPQDMQPYFKIRMYDGSGNEIMCAHYDVDATSAGSIGGFQSIINGSTELLYKDWSPVLIPLVNYVGQNVTITFETSDCAGGGHSGIAYLAVDCSPFPGITEVSNPCNSTKTLTAPSGLSTYSWSGTGGIISQVNAQSITVNSAGTYSVTMTTLGNSGFTCTINIDTTITAPSPTPVASFTNTTVCVGGSPTQFTDASTLYGDTVTTWTWIFGDGAISTAFNPLHAYASAGSFSVSYTITTNHGCTFTHSATVLVNPIPVASFIAAPACLGTPTVFTNTSVGGNTYNWNFGDGTPVSTLQNPSHIYLTVGSFNVNYTVTATGGCSVTYSMSVNVNPSPTVGFNVTPVCKGAQTIFNNTSSGGNSYNWNFGDGSGTSSILNPVYTFATAGNYIVTLSVTNSFNCTVQSTDTAFVYPYPVISFSVSTACLGLPVTFTNNSTPATNVNYSWNFGDGTALSALQSPQHTYSALGTYTTSLTVTSIYGCATSGSNSLTVNPIPSLAVTSPQPMCSGILLPSPSYTINPNNPATTFSWSNNNISIGLPANGIGMIPGFTTAANTTSSNIVGLISITPSLNGCVGAPVTETITIKPTPAVVNPNIDLCPGQSSGLITFTATPVVPSSNISWINTIPSQQIGLPVANGTGSINSFIAINPTNAAVSNVISLQANLNGCFGPISTFSITANPNPLADFSFPVVCVGNPATFTDHSTIGTGSINQWGWDMNHDGAFTDAVVQNPVYLLSTAGYDTVGIQVTSNKGCTDTSYKIIYINSSPVVSFIGDSAGCTPYKTTFSGVATVEWPQFIQSWTWNYGNGSTSFHGNNTTNSIADSVTANYTNNSNTQNAYFTPSLQAVTNLGCSTSMIKNNFITVYPHPKAGFIWDPGFADIIEPTINFHDQSIGASGANAYNWNFGDVFSPATDAFTNYAFVANPSHTYSDQVPYTYSITQIIENTYGCKDSITEQLIIHPAVTFYIPNAFSPNNDGKNEGFKGTGIGINNSTYNLWIFDRWGNMIFHATDLEKSWDGHNKGELVQEDTYVWKVNFYDDLYQYHEYKGIVTVVR